MRLKFLSEGFDFNKPDEQSKYAILFAAIDVLQKIINNASGSRISTTRRLLRNIESNIDEITIESDEEQDYINQILSFISAAVEQLDGLPDGPPPEDAIRYISILSQSIYDFCIKHKHRGGDAI